VLEISAGSQFKGEVIITSPSGEQIGVSWQKQHLKLQDDPILSRFISQKNLRNHNGDAAQTRATTVLYRKGVAPG
jgi:hypothetical protein